MNLNSLFSKTQIEGICINCNNKTYSRKIDSGKFEGMFWKTPTEHCTICIAKSLKEDEEKNKKERESLVNYRQKNYRAIAIKQGMPVRFDDVKISDFNKQQSDVLLEVFTGMRRKKQYIIYGASGIGKSRAAAYVFNVLIYEAILVSETRFSWVNFSDLLLELQKFEEAEYNILREKCFYPKHFVMEFGDTQTEGIKSKGVVSNYARKIFQSIIDYRWKMKLPALYVTAFGGFQSLHKDLLVHFDYATVGRMLEDCQLIKWGKSNKDFRLQKAKQRSIWEV